MAAGEKGLRYRRSDLVAMLEQRILEEEMKYEKDLADWETKMEVWMKRCIDKAVNFADDMLEGVITPQEKFRGLMLWPDLRFDDSPTKPSQPPCRKAQLQQLRTSAQEEITLNQTQFINIVGSEPCPIR